MSDERLQGSAEERIEHLEREIHRLHVVLRKAVSYSEADPEVFLGQARKAAEAICRVIHDRERTRRKGVPELRKRSQLDDMIQLLATHDLVPKHMLLHLRTIQGFGNYGSHDQSDGFEVSSDFIQPCLLALTTFTYWYFTEYLGRPYANPFSSAAEMTAPPRTASDAAADRAPRRTIRFVQPFRSRNDFYFDVESRLSALVRQAGGFDFCIDTPSSDHADDLYRTAVAAARTMGPLDALVLVPREADDPEVLDVVRELSEAARGRLVYFDQFPPAVALDGPDRYFVGVDPAAVGFLAAAGLRRLLGDRAAAASYLLLEGPGGPLRARGFLSAVDELAPGAFVRVESVDDLDRFQIAEAVDELVAELEPDRPWGIFAGNDEIALSVLAAVRECGLTDEVAIAGCDATKEMRFVIDRDASAPVCTVDTEIERQCARLLRVLELGGDSSVSLQTPSPYPADRRAVRALRTSRTGADRTSGREALPDLG
jgi:ABC-type sugar transport system substrate-binding protein